MVIETDACQPGSKSDRDFKESRLTYTCETDPIEKTTGASEPQHVSVRKLIMRQLMYKKELDVSGTVSMFGALR